MNPRHHGDTKDLAKRGFLDLVRGSGWSRALRILPMFTGEFKGADIDAYLSLLGFARQDLISEEKVGTEKEERLAYFEKASKGENLASDLFLDPDRGVVGQLKRKSRDPEVVTFEEVEGLLPKVTQRVLLIYDESVSRAGRRHGMEIKLEQLMASSARLNAFAYFNSAPSQPNILCIGNQ